MQKDCRSNPCPGLVRAFALARLVSSGISAPSLRAFMNNAGFGVGVQNISALRVSSGTAVRVVFRLGGPGRLPQDKQALCARAHGTKRKNGALFCQVFVSCLSPPHQANIRNHSPGTASPNPSGFFMPTSPLCTVVPHCPRLASKADAGRKRVEGGRPIHYPPKKDGHRPAQ